MATTQHWTEQVAEQIERRVLADKGAGATIVCASGISPSGPIHLGNMREEMTVHLVAEALRERGHMTEHIHSWDDFDRLRKVPKGVPDAFAQYIGMPLCDIPDPFGEYGSYAERHIAEFTASMDQLGIRPRYVRQSIAYRRGDYIEGVKKAMALREKIFDFLAEHQTLGTREESVEERRAGYYPFKFYCASCRTDATQIVAYDAATAQGEYACAKCGHRAAFDLNQPADGKLVWKVDWPMRWHHERVDFEPAGEDHSAPGSSFTVGKQIVSAIYGSKAPHFIGYTFVGMGGRSKISSSAGTSAVPRAALDILEPGILRWLYLRRQPNQKFDIDFGNEVLRLYDEWDRLAQNVAAGKASETERYTYEHCMRTSTDAIAQTELRESFRLLSSVADITQGNTEQILRIVAAHGGHDEPLDQLKAKLEPRLSCAWRWISEYLPEDERTTIRGEFAAEAFAALPEQHQQGLRMLVEQLDESWTPDGLTGLIYGIPKDLLGYPRDVKPNEELKQFQRAFFISLYNLLCASETGPRLPTLFLSLGQERVRSLLVPPAAA
ncbi:MAG TPA: lysine--tRNA ligase [Herpetosiphonaceae bacterium]